MTYLELLSAPAQNQWTRMISAYFKMQDMKVLYVVHIEETTQIEKMNPLPPMTK